MSKDDLNQDLEQLQNEIKRITEKESFNEITLLEGNEIVDVNFSFEWSYELLNNVLCIRFPLNIAHYLADVSPDGHLHVDIQVKADLEQDIIMDVNNRKLEIYLSQGFEKQFQSIDIVYMED